MPSRIMDRAQRAGSDYLHEYHFFRSPVKFLYYCRNCVRNFDSEKRVQECPNCKEDTIVELPKGAFLQQHKRDAVAETKEKVSEMSKSLKASANSGIGALKRLVWKAKIAYYYYLVPLPEEEF